MTALSPQEHSGTCKPITSIRNVILILASPDIPFLELVIETNEPGPTKRTQETAIREWQESVGCAGLGLSRQDSEDEPDGAKLPAEKRTRVDA